VITHILFHEGNLVLKPILPVSDLFIFYFCYVLCCIMLDNEFYITPDNCKVQLIFVVGDRSNL
jgi:hypothetical protein